MKEPEVKKLAETVEAGLRDGRKLDSLRKAMGESGYSEDDIRKVISNVDRKKTVRRPQRKRRQYNRGWVAAAILTVVVIGLGSYIFLLQPTQIEEIGPLTENTSGDLRTCYVVNESVKDVMMQAGAQCDRWFLIKEI